MGFLLWEFILLQAVLRRRNLVRDDIA